MNVLIAGFNGLESLDMGIRKLTEYGLTCWEEDDGDEIMALLGKVEFDIIAFRFHPIWTSGIQFRNNPGRPGRTEEDKQCVSPKQFYDSLQRYLKDHDTKSIYAFTPERWPWWTLALYTSGDWDDVLIHPNSYELFTSIERTLFRCLRKNDPLKRFQQLSSRIHMEIRQYSSSDSGIIYTLPLAGSAIRKILEGTEIKINRRILTGQGDPTFPFPLTQWCYEDETYCCYALSKSIPIVTHKRLPFMESVEWVPAGLLESE